MRILLILILLIPNVSYSSWYCDQVASEWVEEGKILSSCGYGTGPDENIAKTVAFENAKVEFKKVCSKGTFCANKVVNIDPQRSDCKKTDDGVECRRLFYFHISQVQRDNSDDEEDNKNRPPLIQNYNTTNVNNITHEHKHFNTINVSPQPTKVINRIVPVDKDKDPRAKVAPYRNHVRSVGNVSIYETNSRQYPGVYLRNPSQGDIDRVVKRASRGGANHIYILRN
jgi:hypothetical protein